MAESITGSVVGKIKFTIDKPSWDNLDKFQKKLTSVKKQMSNMHKTINVNAVTSATKKVADVTTKADKAVTEAKIKTNKQLERHFKQQQDNMLRMQKDYIKRQEQMVRGANKNAGMSDRLSWLFPSSHPTMSASKSLLAMQLREEDKLARDYAKRRDRVVSARDKANAARRKRKAGAVNAQSAYMDSVNAFMTVKESQVRNEAVRKGFYGTDKYAENMKALQKAYSDNVGLGNIKQFRANVNGVVNGMHTAQRAAEANRITFASMRGELVQLTAAYSAFTVVQNIAQTGMEMEGLRASAKVFAKDEAGVADHMKFIADEANRMGVNFQEAARSFTKFSLSTKGKLDKNTQRQLFSGVSEYAAVLQLDTPSYQRFFRAIQQMTDKGLYAEEVYGQMAENAAGSVDALMKAFGYTDSSAFRKRIEQGGLQLTPDKAQAFAKALSDIARSNGALAAVSQKTNAQMQRFLNQLTFAKDEIFKNGMNDGLGYMFNSLSIIMEDLAPLTKVLGGIFKGFVSTMSGLVRVITAPISALVTLLDKIGITNPKIMAVVGSAGTLAVMAWRFKIVQQVLFGVNLQLVAMLRHFARLAIVPLVFEDIWSTVQGRQSLFGSEGPFSSSSIFGNNALTNFLDKPIGSFFSSGETKVTVEVKGEEAAKFINATVEKNTQGKRAATQTEVSQ